MTAPPIATIEDAAALGYNLPADTAEALLNRASVRVRRAAGFPITRTTVTSSIDFDGVPIRMPALTTEVSAVQKDGEDVDFCFTDGRLSAHSCGSLDVTFTIGYETVPDGLVDLVCSIANRLSASDDPEASALQQKSVGQTSVTWKRDSGQTSTGLSNAELEALNEYIPSMRVGMIRVRDFRCA